MGRTERITEAITSHGKIAIAVMLVLTGVMGAGAGMVEQSSSLDQFQSDTKAAQKLDYINDNFSTGPDNQTTVQIIARGENVLDKQSLVSILELQQAFRNNETINRTLVENQSLVGVPNFVATAAIQGEHSRELQTTTAKFKRLNRTVQQERTAVAERNATLTDTAGALRDALTTLRTNQSASVRTQFEQVNANTSVELNQTNYATFNRSASLLRTAENQSQAQQAYQMGTQGLLADDYRQLQQRSQQLQQQTARLQELGQQRQQQQAALQNASSPTLQEQIDQLESMNASEIDRTLETVLSANASGSMSALAFMPSSYEPNSTSANATMLIVTQQSDGSTAPTGGTASDEVTNAQLAMQDIAAEHPDENGLQTIVFGSGIISEEITNSMSDSLLIVGPLALLFVLLTLIVAYRDLLDIVLGLIGIGAVLVWTFGFMGWADIAFNQLFIAVPVLLIGLSIDYAIHIFMRHREERQELGNGVRSSMSVALAGVGVALVWVTATTVIGFLSNLTSPIPPIQNFAVLNRC